MPRAEITSDKPSSSILIAGPYYFRVADNQDFVLAVGLNV